MPITLKQEQEKFILDKIQQGKYENVDALLLIAFRLLDESEQKQQELDRLREKILAGKKQIEEGKVTDGEVVFQRLGAKLKQIMVNQ